MRNILINISVFLMFFLIFSFLNFSNLYAEEEVITVSGQITHLDLTARTLSIAYADENNLPQEISLVYSEALEVFEAAGVESLSVGDKVSADYFYNEQSKPEAASIYRF